MYIGVLQGVPFELLLWKEGDKPWIELKVVGLNKGPHDAKRNNIWIWHHKIP